MMQSFAFSHIPVMLDEVLGAMNLSNIRWVVDATYGRGGHTEAIMKKLPCNARLIVMDRDMEAIRDAQSKWEEIPNIEIIHTSFSRLKEVLESRNLVGKIDAILFDFGVSSPQIDCSDRGFSFQKDGPLDMRMDKTQELTAKIWLKRTAERDLAQALKTLGEEKFAKRIARQIKQTLLQKEISTTGQLSQVISQAVPYREPGKHPATRTFQAIRIAVNSELEEIKVVLPDVLDALSVDGRMVMISFHSLEDRLIKRFFRQQAKGDPFPVDLPVKHSMLNPRLKIIGKTTKASANEIDKNPRSRSAVMRVAQKIA